jgi:hypothetical protein
MGPRILQLQQDHGTMQNQVGAMLHFSQFLGQSVDALWHQAEDLANQNLGTSQGLIAMQAVEAQTGQGLQFLHAAYSQLEKRFGDLKNDVVSEFAKVRGEIEGKFQAVNGQHETCVAQMTRICAQHQVELVQIGALHEKKISELLEEHRKAERQMGAEFSGEKEALLTSFSAQLQKISTLCAEMREDQTKINRNLVGRLGELEERVQSQPREDQVGLPQAVAENRADLAEMQEWAHSQPCENERRNLKQDLTDLRDGIGQLRGQNERGARISVQDRPTLVAGGTSGRGPATTTPTETGTPGIGLPNPQPVQASGMALGTRPPSRHCVKGGGQPESTRERGGSP